jgi:hypothetical protein
MYINIIINVRAGDGESSVFHIKIGLHKKIVWSLYIFILITNEVTEDIQEDSPWCILFVDIMMLIDESRIRVN